MEGGGWWVGRGTVEWCGGDPEGKGGEGKGRKGSRGWVEGGEGRG